MIDVTNMVVREVKKALANYPDVKVFSSYVDETEVLPAVTVYEVDNYIDKSTMDSDGAEHYAYVTYDIAVYTSTEGVKKQLAKEMFTEINDRLVNLNFVRTFKSELPNQDRKVYRYQGRFQARVSENIELEDGTIINNVYRR